MKNELFERELQNTSINDVSLADYVKENYLPISVLDKIRAEIKQTAYEEQKYDEKWAIGLRYAVRIIDKYKAESEIHCNCTDAEIAKSFIEDVEAVKAFLPMSEFKQAESKEI